jgi:mannosylglucosylglycerate synthase
MKIAFVATRISGNDGVSLEADHWREILQKMGHRVTFVTGKLDREGILIPELHFQHPEAVEMHERVIYGKDKLKNIEEKIYSNAGFLEGKLRSIFAKHKFDLVIAPNVLSLPMHFGLAVALTRVLQESKTPAIARNHDFWWERERFRNSTMFSFFKKWFPPNMPNMEHVVINSRAKQELKKRTGIEAEIIWDSFDFEDESKKRIDKYNTGFRKDFGLNKEDIVFLQATRIVERKRIEISIEFVKKLKNKKAVLIVCGHNGDEPGEYLDFIKNEAKKSGIRYLFIGNRVNSARRIVGANGGGRKKIYTLWDCYVNSDFVLYPTKIEGFGNQFVESIFFRKPVIMTPYTVFREDIKPLGFKVITINRSFDSALRQVSKLIENPELAKKNADYNFELGKKYLSYNWAEGKLEKLFGKMDLN